MKVTQQMHVAIDQIINTMMYTQICCFNLETDPEQSKQFNQ